MPTDSPLQADTKYEATSVERAPVTLELSVMVPARNEEDVIGECLRSLAAQSDEAFLLGRDWELIVVDDGSTDRTRSIAESVPGVTVMSAPPLQTGWTGKANALWAAAKMARGAWLLFTDADTIHEPGNLRRALHEAERAQAKLLSYSPRQIVHGVVQAALMPLVFAELASAYPTQAVSDPKQSLAAANGQFLLVERETYFRVGGHNALAAKVLEDVALAAKVKRLPATIRFRYAADAVAARMYRSTGAMMEGWIKNLALLFPNPLGIAFWRVLDIVILVGLPLFAVYLPQIAPQLPPASRLVVLVWWLWRLALYVQRVMKSNFSVPNCVLSVLALPLFAVLLWRSAMLKMTGGKVQWKGRSYPLE